MEKTKPHALVVPLPAQGHLNPMINLAKILNSRGFYVTVINSEITENHGRFSLGSTVHYAESSTLRFLSIQNEYVPSRQTWCDTIKNDLVVPFRKLVSGLIEAEEGSHGFPPISCIFADGLMTFTLDVAEELSIPSALLFPLNSCTVMVYAHMRQLMEKGLMPPKDENCLKNNYLDKVIDWIPGMKGIQLKDMPSFTRTSSVRDKGFVDYFTSEMERARKATIILLNTFHAIEDKVIGELKSNILPRVSTIGPLHLLGDHVVDKEDSFVQPLSKEDCDYLSWLDSKDPGSVVLVAFGTTSFVTRNQLTEFAWGLANSKQNFLWIVRPNLVVGEPYSDLISLEFLNETKGRGLIAKWCDQQRVLKHPAVEGFLTHCGWNSILESLCAGVPMLFWPTFADQLVNCWLCCKHLGIGLEVDNVVNRDNIETLVRELMVGKKGKEVKNKVMEWKMKANEASLTSGGSSYKNFEKMVEVFMPKPKDDTTSV